MPVNKILRQSNRTISLSHKQIPRGESSRWTVNIDVSNIVSVEKVLRVKCKPGTTVMELKKKLRKSVGYPLEYQRLFVAPNVELKNHMRVIDLDGGAFEDGSENVVFPTLTFKICAPASGVDNLGTICFYGQSPKCKALYTLMMEAQAGLAQRFRPELQMGGSAGTYMLRNQFKDLIACFKPSDEEPRAPNNPRREYVGTLGTTGLREGFKSGQGCYREVAAYLIDAKHHFHGVPYTCLCEAADDAFHYNGGKKVPKLGSFQQFVEHDTCMSDYSSSNLDVDEVHKIGLLDIRIMNVDRNDGNLLVNTHNAASRSSIGSLEADDCGHGNAKNTILVPIDHGYCLPDRIRVDPLDWCWYYWKQCQLPFSERTKKFVAEINVDEDATMLQKELNIDQPSLRTMRITGRLLKIGVEAGLNLFQIAELIAREDPDAPSRLELTILEAISKSRSKMMGQPLARAPHSLPASVLNFQLESAGIEIIKDSDTAITDDSSGDIKISDSGNSSPNSLRSNIYGDITPAEIQASREIKSVLVKMEPSIRRVDCDEDISSLAPSTARVSPDECNVTMKDADDSLNKSESAFTSYNDLNEDVWSNPSFEKDFFRNLEMLIERDVLNVLNSPDV